MSEWVIVAIVGVVLLFSARKLPDMARGLGQSMRIFKAETRGLREDEKAGQANAEPQAPGRQLDEGTSTSTSTPTSAPTSTNGTAQQDATRSQPGSTSS
ncbi:Sec-independent protein translocase subunit TatA [Actinomycetospora straminea]|uniref:Sec-independent protein translocase protein TatA n=1 Tax=Actinomycetospora straminea TaxID=663607 RepID=A0ABP9DXI1_9PSEU|nr:Sec-independent protein translocase subunit TatA [Actinomycetospora straminea]MDD7935886.1 Sec-independent protein translocase subunit TatA [Actinomycetospora straminea]